MYRRNSNMRENNHLRLLGWAALLVLAISLLPVLAEATPNPTSAVVRTRIFNDCPASILTYENNYPASIWIQDEIAECGGANLHNWRFSDNGVDPAVFNNDSNFRFGADLVVSGTAHAESGLQIAPWWAQDVDGRLNIRIPDGEIACFGGRLPFFSFTAQFGITYVADTPIHLEMEYLCHGLSETDPATILYTVIYNNTTYQSPVLNFDMGNPNEPYGLWGMLNDGRVGGHFQPFLWANIPNVQARATWSNIFFENMDPTPVENTSWGRVKSLYHH
jgi:hypothetical protein